MDTDARRLMADTIKLFSDTGVKSTIILVGVADSVGELIAEHKSISRNVAQIAVDPMTIPELADIIRKGYERVGLAYADSLPRQVSELSHGYPHYTHLLGLWAGRRALEASRDVVIYIDLTEAIPAALENATGGVQQEYASAVASSQPDALFEKVFLSCALAHKDSVGKFAATDVRAPLRRIMGRDILRASISWRAR